MKSKMKIKDRRVRERKTSIAARAVYTEYVYDE
jgi:hypothetical protein